MKKKISAGACRKKKIACSTNVIEGTWEKREKKYPAHRIARKKKKILMTRNHPPPPPPLSRVQWSAHKLPIVVIQNFATMVT